MVGCVRDISDVVRYCWSDRENNRKSSVKEEKMEEMKMKDDLMESLKNAVKMLAVQRAMMMKLEVATEEEITEFINQEGVKWAEKYDKMDPLEILFEQMMELAEASAKIKEGK